MRLMRRSARACGWNVWAMTFRAHGAFAGGACRGDDKLTRSVVRPACELYSLPPGHTDSPERWAPLNSLFCCDLGNTRPFANRSWQLRGETLNQGGQAVCAGLTPAGVAHSWALGTAVYSAFGPGGYAMVCLYFILGSLVGLSLMQSSIALRHSPYICACPVLPLALAQSKPHHQHRSTPLTGGLFAGAPQDNACAGCAEIEMLLQVTKVKLAQKQKEGIAEARSGRRQPVSYLWQQPHYVKSTLTILVLLTHAGHQSGLSEA